MIKKTIWGNAIVKNEDRYFWFGIASVIDYLDKVLIWDTGSSDQTINIIKDFKKKYPHKIEDRYFTEVDKNIFSKLRQEMLQETKSDWFLILDGDEVWWKNSIESIANIIQKKGDDLDCIVSPTINLIGDIYHYQEEKAGKYELLGMKGHFNIRAINRKIPGLHVDRPYGSEGYFDNDNLPIQDRPRERILFLDKPYLHFTHLRRSSLSSGDQKTMMRSQKIKYELGHKFNNDFKYPEVLDKSYPDFILDPWQRASSRYKLRAMIETPLKKLKRRVLK